jgi:hypothetical protein
MYRAIHTNNIVYKEASQEVIEDSRLGLALNLLSKRISLNSCFERPKHRASLLKMILFRCTQIAQVANMITSI